jgi:signal transduction histidine kinase
MSRRLLGSFLTLTLLVLLVLELPLGITFADHERDRLTTQVERDAVVLSTFVEDALQEHAPVATATLQTYSEKTGARVVVVDANGRAVADTDSSASTWRSFSSRPEIRTALAGRVATGLRHSATLGHDLLYVAVPVASSGDVYGAVRVTYPSAVLDHRVTRYWWTLAAVAVVALVAATALGLVLARSVASPMRRLERASLALGAGDLSARVGDVGGPPVVRSVASVFDETATRLEQLVAAQDAFVGDASHQLRNPLTALRLRLENLRVDVTDDGRDDLERALDEVMRLSRMVDGLLLLARGEGGGAHPATEVVDLAALVEDRRATWAPLADERDVVVRSEVEPGCRVGATDDHARQIIDNLLANAIDAAPGGSEIVLRGVRVDGAVELHVVDAGPGLSPEERAHAFDRFWRSPQAPGGDLGGSGLGLAIVHKLAEADGATVELAEAPTGGVDAVVRFRAASAPDAAERASRRTR